MIYKQPRDIENQIIGGAISQIPPIINYTVVSGSWTPVITTTDTKEILLQSRSMNTWLLATASGSSEFFTVKNGGAINTRLVTTSGTTIFWVSTYQSSDTIEMIEGR